MACPYHRGKKYYEENKENKKIPIKQLKIKTETKCDDSDELLVFGNYYGYEAELFWCRIVNVKEWFSISRTIIGINPIHEYPNEIFGGRTSDSCITALEFLTNSNVCNCKHLINAYNSLCNEGICKNIGIDIIGNLKSAIDATQEEEYAERSVIKTYNKKNNNDSCKEIEQTYSFKYFVINNMFELKEDKNNDNMKTLYNFINKNKKLIINTSYYECGIRYDDENQDKNENDGNNTDEDN